MSEGVSVLTTVRNGEAFLPAFLDNFASETVEPLQLVVVDDRSTDGTAQILAGGARRDERITVCTSIAPGRGNALNTGLSVCRYPYVAIQDVDDLSVPWRLRVSRSILEARPDISLIGGSALERYSLDEQVREPEAPCVSRLVDRVERIDCLLRGGNPLAHSTVMARTDILRAVGGYDVERRSQFDYELYFRLSRAGYGVYRVPVPMTIRLVHDRSSFEARNRLLYRLRSARLQYRILWDSDGPRSDWVRPPLVVAGAFAPRRTWSACRRRLDARFPSLSAFSDTPQA